MVAEVAAKTGILEVVTKCYSNATHLDPSNLTLQAHKTNFYHQLGMHAIDTYEKHFEVSIDLGRKEQFKRIAQKVIN